MMLDWHGKMPVMDNLKHSKIYDLSSRTLQFSKDVRAFVRVLPRTISNFSDVRQLVRSSGSIGTNYIEACECLSKKDFAMRIKISRKEAKESIYWLHLLDTQNSNQESTRNMLVQECTELMKIFGSIITESHP